MECVCESGLPQLYLGACRDYIKKVSTVLPLQLVAKDGTLNSIDLTAIPVPESVFTAMFKQSDSTKRLHYLSGLKNFLGEMSENKLKTWDDDTTTKLSDGQLKVSFIVPEASPLHAYYMQGLECNNPGVYLQTESNQLIGYGNPSTIATDKKLYPIPVERWGIQANPFTSSSEVAQVMITIYFPISLNLGNMVIMNGSEHQLIANKNYEAKPVVLTVGALTATTTSVNVKATRPSGGILGNTAPISGLLVVDFKIYNRTTLAVVPVVSVSETPAGNYVLTFAAQTSADVLEVTSGVSNMVTIAIP